MAEEVTLQEVEDALSSVREVEGCLVVQIRDDGSVKKLAQRDPVNNYPARIVVLNSRADAAAKFRATSEARTGGYEADSGASPGDTPPTDEQPRGQSE